MAIEQALTLESGLVVEQAYIRVQGVNGNKNLAAISVEVYVSQELCAGGKRPVDYKTYTFVPSQEEDAPRWDKQAYEHLKTLPEYADAVDA